MLSLQAPPGILPAGPAAADRGVQVRPAVVRGGEETLDPQPSALNP